MSKTPFMPLWVADFVGDTLDLEAKEIGAYMLLLMTMWGREGYLPNDQKKLQRVARCGRDWPRVWAAIHHYFTVEGDLITQARLQKELQKVASKVAVNSQSGARGGRAKALKYKEATLANATVSPKQPEPEPYREEERDKSLLSFQEKNDDLPEAFEAYNDAAKAVGWPAVQSRTKARSAALKARLSECGGIDGWRAALAKARASPHLCGQNDRGWTASFDFLTTASSFAKLMEGNYDPRQPATAQRQPSPTAAFNASINRIADGLNAGTVHLDFDRNNPLAQLARRNTQTG